MLKKILINCTLVAVSIVFILICLEMYFRFFRPVNLPVFTYSEYGWKHVPNIKTKYRSAAGEFEVINEYNSSGLRSDLEYSYEKPEGIYRILTLGDSFTDAREVSIEDTWARRLETLFNQNKTPKVEVLNAGVAGYGTHQCYAYLVKEGIKFQPDLVIYLFTGAPHRNVDGLAKFGDKGEIVLTEMKVPQKHINYLKARAFLKRHSHLVTYLTDILGITTKVKGYLKGDAPTAPQQCKKNRDITAPAVGKYLITGQEDLDRWKLTYAIIGAMDKFARRNQTRFLLVYISCLDTMPYSELLDNKIMKADLCFLKYYRREFNREISYNEILPCFYPKDGHFNVDGNRLAAEIIYEKINSLNLY